jgi:uncharacterized membrane protein
VAGFQHAVPFIWDSNANPRLAELPPVLDRDLTFAWAINDAGIIVGTAYNNTPPYNQVACRWEKVGNEWALLPFLPALPPWPQACAIGINDSGFIVGFSGDDLTMVACGWDPNANYQPTRLADLGGPGGSWAFAVNGSNQYVGISSTPEGPYRAFFYDGNECINLGAPPGYESYASFAARVNNGGTVVGYGHKHDPFWTSDWDDPNTRAFVWRRGVLTVLNDALVGGAGWDVKQALDINEGGQIAGIMYNGQQWRACRLTPAYADLNCDGVISFDDIDPFVLALSDPAGYQQQYPNCDALDGDCNGDGAVTFDDINPFVALLSG